MASPLNRIKQKATNAANAVTSGDVIGAAKGAGNLSADFATGGAATGLESLGMGANDQLKKLDPTAKKARTIDGGVGSNIANVNAPTIAANPLLTSTTLGSVANATSPVIDVAQAERARGEQVALMQQLAAQSRGEGPSVATEALRQGQEANLAATRAQLASTRGGANAAIARQTMTTSADIQAKTAQDAAMARLQEQLQAQGLLSQTAATVRGQDEAQAAQNAQFVQQTALANMQKDLELAVNQGRISAGEASQIFAAEVARNSQAAQLGMQAALANQGRDLSVAGLGQAASQFNAGQLAAKDRIGMDIAAGIINAGAQVGASAAGAPGAAPQVVAPEGADTEPVASDKHLKKDVKNASKDIKGFLDAVNAQSYTYKSKQDGAADRYVSPMAQDLEKHPLGDSMVVDTPRGKMVDYQRASGFLLAATSDLNKRLEALEGNKKGKK